MNRILAAAVTIAVAVIPALATDLKTYATETEATKLCKSPVVWANPDSKVYHRQGSRWYGSTKEGVWACEAAAKRAGLTAAKNKQ